MLDQTVSRIGPASPGAPRACAALRELARTLEPSRTRMSTGDVLFQAGDRANSLHVLDAGLMRLVEPHSMNGSYRFRGDWLGLEGIARGHHAQTAIARDCCVVWSIRCEALVAAGRFEPILMRAARAIVMRPTGDSANATLLADTPEAKVTGFLLAWARALVREGRNRQQLGLRVTRAELAGYLELQRPVVDLALASLAARNVIVCSRNRRHEIQLDDLMRLEAVAALPAMAA